MSVSIDTLSIEISANAGNAANSLNQLADAMGKLRTNAAMTKVANNMNKLSSALATLNNTGGSGIANLQRLANAMQGLAGLGKIASLTPMINQLKKIPDVMAGLDDTTVTRFANTLKVLGENLAPLSGHIDKVNRGLQTLPNSIRRSTSAVESYNSEAKRTKTVTMQAGSALDMMGSRFSGLATKAAGAYYALSRVSTTIAGWVQEAIQWDGIANRFSYSFGEAADSVYQHVQRVSEALFINEQQFMQYAGTFGSIARGFGLVEEKIVPMSVGLTELAYDLYAYANDVYPSLEEAANAVRSAITGEIEPIRRAGISITEAMLKEKAAALGVTESYESMTEAQKSILRYQAMVDAAMRQGVVGTYAREIDTAEGAVRMLEQNIRSLAQSLGSLFIPALNTVIPYITAFIQVVLQAISAIAGFFGFRATARTSSFGTGSSGGAKAAGGFASAGAAASAATASVAAYSGAMATAEIACADAAGSLTEVSSAMATFDGATAYSDMNDAVAATNDSINSTASGLSDATEEAKKLKSVAMGFDELNIISPEQKSSGGSGGGGGGGAGGGAGGMGADLGVDLESLWDDSIFDQVQSKVDELAAKLKAFFDKWKTELAIIGAALAALGIAKLLEHLGRALHLGDKFIEAMRFIQKLASTVIIITLQWMLQKIAFEKFIGDDGTIWDYVKAMLIGAASTWVLYSMWGPTGLVIGFGVTAAAALSTVIENGGITNWESALVLLTGLATGATSVFLAWKQLKELNLPLLFTGTWLGNVLSGTKMLKDGTLTVQHFVQGVVGLKNLNIISTIASEFLIAAEAVGTFLAGISAPVWGAIAGILAAIGSAAWYLRQNWEGVKQAFQDWFAMNIQPKLDAIQQSFDRMKEAVGRAKDALRELIPDWLWEKFEQMADAIGKAKDAFLEWIKSLDPLKALGQVIEAVGSIVVGVVGGVIAGAFNTAVQVIEGFVRTFSGLVEVVSGVVQFIVSIFTGDAQMCVQAAKDIVSGVVECFTGLKDMVVDALIAFVEGVISWFEELADVLVGHSIVPDMMTDIVTCFAELPGAVFDILAGFVEATIQQFTDMWHSVVDFFTTALPNWWNNTVAPWFEGSRWTTMVSTIKTTIITTLTQMVTEWTQKITNWWNQNVAPWFTAAKWQGLAKSIFEIINGFTQMVSQWVTAITNWWNSHVQPWFTPDKWKQLGQAILQILTSLSEMVSQWATSISSWWNEHVAPWFTWEKWSSLGRNAIDGLIAGLGDIYNKGIGLGKKLYQGFKDAMGIASPSKVMIEAGGYIVDGLALGTSAVSEVGLAVGNAFTEGVATGVSGMTGLLEQNVESLTLSAPENVACMVEDALADSGIYDYTGHEWMQTAEAMAEYVDHTATMSQTLTAFYQGFMNGMEQHFAFTEQLLTALGYNENAYESPMDETNQMSQETWAYVCEQLFLIGEHLLFDKEHMLWMQEQVIAFTEWQRELWDVVPGHLIDGIVNGVDAALIRYQVEHVWWLNAILMAIFSAAREIGDDINKIADAISKIQINVSCGGGGSPGAADTVAQTQAAAQYARGGFPRSGELFWAREDGGAELVGRMGNRTAVANNQQIVEGIQKGVYDAVKQAMGQSEGSGSQNVNVYLDGKQITAAVEKTQRERGRQIMSSRL